MRNFLSTCGMKAALAIMFVVSAQQLAFCQQVSVATQKTAYALKEKIIVTITNTLPVSIFTIAASKQPEMGLTNIEKKASVGWDALPLRCRQPSCNADYTIPDAQEVKAGASATFSWQPKIYANAGYIDPDPGLYRITVLYQVKKDGNSDSWNWTTVRSNTFTLE